MALNPHQAKQLEMQLSEHRHSRYTTDIKLSESKTLSGFAVHPEVMRPERMTSLRLARFLWENKWIYDGKAAIDMGCGSGIQGVTMAENGAAHVYMLDISSAAVSNSWENVGRYNLEEKAMVLQSDLFGRLICKADAIVFNHPFFSDSPEGKAPVAVSMLDAGELIHRFLHDAKIYLAEGGRLIMPFFHLAGPTNDPGIQGPRHGYIVTELSCTSVVDGLQKGDIPIYGLTRR